MGCGQKSFKVVWRWPSPACIPSQRPLAPSFTSVTSVANDMGDNEMISRSVSNLLAFALRLRKTPEKLSWETIWWRGCAWNGAPSRQMRSVGSHSTWRWKWKERRKGRGVFYNSYSLYFSYLRHNQMKILFLFRFGKRSLKWKMILYFKRKMWTWTGTRTRTSRSLAWRSTIELSWFNCQFTSKPKCEISLLSGQ